MLHQPPSLLTPPYEDCTVIEVEVMLQPTVSRTMYLGVGLQIIVFCPTMAGFLIWAPSLTRGWVCNLLVQLLLGLARAVTLGSKFRRTHGHILLSHLRLQVPVYPPGTGWPSYTPGHSVLFSSPLAAHRAKSQSQSYITTGSHSATPRPNCQILYTVAGFLMWGVLSDERTGISYFWANMPQYVQISLRKLLRVSGWGGREAESFYICQTVGVKFLHRSSTFSLSLPPSLWRTRMCRPNCSSVHLHSFAGPQASCACAVVVFTVTHLSWRHLSCWFNVLDGGEKRDKATTQLQTFYGVASRGPEHNLFILLEIPRSVLALILPVSLPIPRPCRWRRCSKPKKDSTQ
jgi:hypothetical protein